MNTSKLLITSLLAAAAMSAVPAYGFSKVTVATTDGVAIVTNTSSQTSQDTIYLNAEEADSNITSYVFNLSGGFFSATAGGSAGTNNNRTQRITKDVVIQNLTINNGYSNSYAEFAGAVSGSGNIAITAANGQDLLFTGDVSQFSGNITYSGALLGTGGNQDLGSYVGTLGETGNKNVGIIQFGGAKAYDSAGTTAVSKTAISGTGEISTASVLRYNFAAESDGAALTVTNSSISARYLEFKGGANYTVSSEVTGNNTPASNNTLTISAGTTTFTGEVSNFGNVTVASGATLAVGTGGSLDLSGATVSLANAIQNSGAVTISNTTVFNLTRTGETRLIDGGAIAGVVWNTLGLSNFAYNGDTLGGRSSVDVSTTGAVTLITYAAKKTLTWNGDASGAGTWETATFGTEPANKPWLDGDTAEAFYNGDSVTFATEGAQVSVEGTVNPAAITVSTATSLTGTGTVNVAAANLTTTAALTLGDNVVLDLGSISDPTSKTISGTGTVKVVSSSGGHGATLTLGSDFSGTIEYSGKFNTSNGNGTNNSNAKFALSNGSMWGGGTVANDIHFLTNYQLGDSQTTTIVLNGNLTQEAGTTLTIANANITFRGAATLGTLNVTGGTTNFSGTTNITSATVTGGVLKFDVGALDAENTFSSASTLAVNGGRVVFGYEAGYGTIRRGSFGQNLSVVVGSGAKMTIAIAQNSMKAFSGNLTLKNGATYYKFDGGVELAGNVTLGEADSDVVSLLGNWGKLGTKISGSLSGAGTAYFGSEADSTVEKLTISGSDNSYSGEIIVGKKNANTDSVRNTELVLSAEKALQNGKVNLAGSAANNYAQLTLGASAITIAGLSGTEFGKVALVSDVASSTLTVNQASDTTFAGTIEGGIALKKTGAGKLTLSGDNTFTGGTVIEAGTLVAGSETALGTGTTVTVTGDAKLALGEGFEGLSISNNVSIADSVKLTLGGGYAVGLNGAITGSGTLRTALPADMLMQKITLGGDNSGFSGAVEVVGTTVDAAHASALGTGILKISSADSAFGSAPGNVQASTAGVVLHDVSIELVRTDSAALRTSTGNNFTVAEGATLYLDIGALGADVLTGEQVALTIAARNAIDSFFSTVEVGTYVDDVWQISSEWKYLEYSWDESAGTLSITAIPEPSVFGLLAGLGALALAGTRRRRRKA